MPRSPMLFDSSHIRGINYIKGLGGASLVEVVCVCMYADDINRLESLRTTSSLKECLWNMFNSMSTWG